MSKSKVSEMAKRLGFSQEQIEEITGYSRQFLWMIFAGKSKPTENRFHAAVKSIKYAIEEEYKRDVQELEARYAARRKAAEELLYIIKEGEP